MGKSLGGFKNGKKVAYREIAGAYQTGNGKNVADRLKRPANWFRDVTDVELTGDLRSAKIFVSIMGDDDKIKNSLEGLQSALGFIRREIGQRIKIRFTPEISFALDTSLDYGDHIQKLLLKVEGDTKNVDNVQAGSEQTQSRE